jgi:D-alanyl-D-alanine carboxypeptidase
VLRDPAGLDDSFAVDGGNLVSARDLAIIGRAALSQPLVAQAVATPVYRFVGPDGTQHRLGNHNRLLVTYRGAIGVKTGYTAKAGENLIAAARRGNRTILAVLLGAPNLYVNAGSLLDRGFATSAASGGTGDVLPEVHSVSAPPASGAVPAALKGNPPPLARGGDNTLVLAVGTVMLLAALLLSARRRVVRERRARRRRHAPSRPASRRQQPSGRTISSLERHRRVEEAAARISAGRR